MWEAAEQDEAMETRTEAEEPVEASRAGEQESVSETDEATVAEFEDRFDTATVSKVKLSKQLGTKPAKAGRLEGRPKLVKQWLAEVMAHVGDKAQAPEDRWARRLADSQIQVDLRPDDCNIKYFYPSTPQHNVLYYQKTAYAASIYHTPTGIRVMCSQSKNRDVNRRIALRTLHNKLNTFANSGLADDSLKPTIYKRRDKKKMHQMERRKVKQELRV